MRIVPDSLKDPVLNLAFSGLTLLAVVLTLDQTSSRRTTSPAASHPSRCHACSASTPHIAHHRDAALARMGAIDPAEIID